MTIGHNWRALRSKWDALRPKSRALVGLALLAAAGVLVGLGVIAGGSAEDPPGTSAAEVGQEVGAPRSDSADVRKPTARRAGTHAASTTPIAPRRLKIPSLDIDAPVLPITPEGSSLVPPSDPQTVGWWSDGARPGADHGTAILTGHTVSTGGGVFDDLEHMRPGQRVQILSHGHRLRLRVASVRTYHKTTLADHAAEIFDQTSAGRTALVTCEDWNGSEYLSNVVVIATPAH